MSVSGSYDFTNTTTDIIKSAYSLLGVIDPEETLSAADSADGKRDLNNLVKFMSIYPGLWLRTDVTVTLTPGTPSYTMGVGETIDTPTPKRIIDARTYSSYDLPIGIKSRDEYISIPNKTLQSMPVMVHYAPGRTTGTLYVWPTGDAVNFTLKLTTHRPIQDFDIASNNPDFPEEWILGLQYMLADVIAPRKLGGVVPPDIASRAAGFLTSLQSFDAELGSVYIS